MSKKKIRFMCTAFRDGFQSVYGARVFTQDFLPAVEAACDAGINYFEAGGGARFQSLYFYLPDPQQLLFLQLPLNASARLLYKPIHTPYTLS